MTSILTDLQDALALVQADALPVLTDQKARLDVNSDEFGSCSVALRQLARHCETFQFEFEIIEAVNCKPAERNERQKLVFKLHYWCSRLAGTCAFLPEVAGKCASPKRSSASEQLNAKQQLSAAVINLQHYIAAAERALTPFTSPTLCGAD